MYRFPVVNKNIYEGSYPSSMREQYNKLMIYEYVMWFIQRSGNFPAGFHDKKADSNPFRFRKCYM